VGASEPEQTRPTEVTPYSALLPQLVVAAAALKQPRTRAQTADLAAAATDMGHRHQLKLAALVFQAKGLQAELVAQEQQATRLVVAADRQRLVQIMPPTKQALGAQERPIQSLEAPLLTLEAAGADAIRDRQRVPVDRVAAAAAR